MHGHHRLENDESPLLCLGFLILAILTALALPKALCFHLRLCLPARGVRIRSGGNSALLAVVRASGSANKAELSQSERARGPLLKGIFFAFTASPPSLWLLWPSCLPSLLWKSCGNLSRKSEPTLAGADACRLRASEARSGSMGWSADETGSLVAGAFRKGVDGFEHSPDLIELCESQLGSN